MNFQSVNLEVVANKAFTVLASRRAWVAFFTLYLMLIGGPDAADYADQLGDQAVGWVDVLIQVVGPIVTLLGLQLSFHLRPPTKDDYKSVTSDLAEAFNNLVE